MASPQGVSPGAAVVEHGKVSVAVVAEHRTTPLEVRATPTQSRSRERAPATRPQESKRGGSVRGPGGNACVPSSVA